LFEESILRIHVRQEAAEKVGRSRLGRLDKEGSGKEVSTEKAVEAWFLKRRVHFSS
jgi:hypothetical protein